jgi:hypothetical protein
LADGPEDVEGLVGGLEVPVLGDVGEVDGELGPDDTTMVTCAPC